MKTTGEMMAEIEVLEFKIKRLENELMEAEKKRKTLIEKIEMNLISDCFDGKN